MTGKRDTADAIAAFLNRYRAERLGHPVAFEEVGRPKRYTFVDDVTGIRANAFHSEDAAVTIDGEEVDHDIDDLSISVDFETDMYESVGKAAEEKAFRMLFEGAATSHARVDRPVTASFLFGVVHDLRAAGYARKPLYTPGKIHEAVGGDGAAFFVGEDVGDDLDDDFDRMSRIDATPGDHANPHVDGFPIEVSKDLPDTKGVFVDTKALAPPVPGTSAMVRPFEVRDPQGVVAFEKIETEFEWAEGGR